MKKNIAILSLLIGLVFSLACNPKITALTKDLIPKLFPKVIQHGKNLSNIPFEIRRTNSGQIFINDEGNHVQKIMLFSTMKNDDGGEENKSLVVEIIEPDVDTAIAVSTDIDNFSLQNISTNTVLPSVLKLNDTTFLEADIVIQDLIPHLSDSTSIVTGLAQKENSSSQSVFRDNNQQHTHYKTLWIYQQDSVNLFLGKTLTTE